MHKNRMSLVAVAAALAAMSVSAQAIDKKYRAKLERSGCTQLSEMQGCDINKTKAENAKAGFGAASHPLPPASPMPRYKDLAHSDSISAIDTIMSRGFRNVDSIETGSTQYGIFFHPASKLCVQMTMADGEVMSIDDIHSHPKCR